MRAAGVSKPGRPGNGEYLLVAAIIAAGLAMIVSAVRRPAVPAAAHELAQPMCAMFALTAFVWLLMVASRNIGVFLGAAPVAWFRDFQGPAPKEWIERPARAFNNLMQVPTLFYVASLLLISLQSVDSTQTRLAWIFVALRAAHAAVYIAVNYVPARFALYAASCLALGAMWIRLAFYPVAA